MPSNSLADVAVPRMRPRPGDDRPERILVQDGYDPKLANMPPGAWEPISYLASERAEAILRIEAMDLPVDLEWVRDLTLRRWEQMGAWIEQLEEKSVGVKGLRSWQLVQSFQAQPNSPINQASGIVPTPPQAPSEVKRGIIPTRRQ